MKARILNKITEKLEGTDWAIFSGFAVEIYTNGKRKTENDIDILVDARDIKVLEKRFGTDANQRHFQKDNFVVDDYGFVTSFKGIELEITTGFPPTRVRNGTIRKVFENKICKKYKDIDIFVVPIEELIVLKASMGRDKDIKDLKLLKDCDYNLDLINDFAEDYDNEKKILQTLERLSFTNPRGL